MKTLLVVASRTDKTKSFIPTIKNHAIGEIVECFNFDISPISFDKIIIGSYTWSNGKIPKRMKEYLIKYHKELKGKKIFIYGSGLSVYPYFCGACDGIATICRDSAADVRFIFKYELWFNEEDFLKDEIREMKQALNCFFES